MTSLVRKRYMHFTRLDLNTSLDTSDIWELRI